MDHPTQSSWTYVEIYVFDGDRVLRPTHLCGTDVTFTAAPEFESDTVLIMTKNGDRTVTRTARVLQHNRSDRRVPIELLGDPVVNHEASINAPTKLTA